MDLSKFHNQLDSADQIQQFPHQIFTATDYPWLSPAYLSKETSVHTCKWKQDETGKNGSFQSIYICFYVQCARITCYIINI